MKLADFGLTTIADGTIGTFTAKGGGSTRWMAPELFDPDEEFRRTKPTDVWSYGCVCWEVRAYSRKRRARADHRHCQLYTLSRPFPRIMHEVQVMFHVMNGGRLDRPTVEESLGRPMPDRVWNFARLTWRREPEARPSMEYIVAEMRLLLPLAHDQQPR